MLKVDLVTEYRLFRHAVSIGERGKDFSDITAREHAGMYLSMFDASALSNFDQVCDVSYREMSQAAWETRRLLQEALAEEDPEEEL